MKRLAARKSGFPRPCVAKKPTQGVGFCIWEHMYFFYVDEAGSPTLHTDPLIPGETPLFTLTAISILAYHWRDLTQDYSSLKSKFFTREIGRKRPQYYEVKGNQLLRPSNSSSSRRIVFTHRVFDLLKKYGAKLFAVVFIKNPTNPTSKMSLYTHGLQVLSERLHTYINEMGDPSVQGITILDGRLKSLDEQVARSHLSFIFGHAQGRFYRSLVEAPVFVDSRLSSGIQLADIMASCIYSINYHKYCSGVGNALNYSHAQRFQNRVDEIEFHSTNQYDGFTMHGIRVINHNA